MLGSSVSFNVGSRSRFSVVRGHQDTRGNEYTARRHVVRSRPTGRQSLISDGRKMKDIDQGTSNNTKVWAALPITGTSIPTCESGRCIFGLLWPIPLSPVDRRMPDPFPSGGSESNGNSPIAHLARHDQQASPLTRTGGMCSCQLQ
jgi:hypothetical protein